MPPKRKGFDPDAAKRTAKKIKAQCSTTQSIVDAAEVFLSAISAADLDNSISFCKRSYSELLLVGLLGISGAYKLSLANKIVPMNYPERLCLITTLFNNNSGEIEKVSTN